MPQYDPQKLNILIELREEARLTQKQVAEFFGLSDRRSIAAWESGVNRPSLTRRSRFVVYLLDKLNLRSQPKDFLKVWEKVMGEWGWKPLSDDELRDSFPGRIKEINYRTPNTVELVFFSGEQHTVPFLAPPRPAYQLIGRDGLMRELKRRLFSGETLALTAFKGMPGVGKTALALALAHDHEVLEHFQDGVLWASVGRSGNVLSHLGTWALALGILPTEVTKLTSIEERAKAVLRAIGTRKMLLVADDVWESQIALSLRLVGPNCAFIATTRLPEVALETVSEPTTVSELNAEDSLKLLSRLAPEVVRAEPDVARILVQVVGGLPLALVLMGNYLRKKVPAGQPRRLREALDKLKETQERLQIAEPQPPAAEHPSLPAGASISLEAIIGISDEALDEDARYTLRALSVFPPKPNSFLEEAALAVSGKPSWTLDALYDFGLLEIVRPGRYTMHQEIFDYARVKLTDTDVYERMIQFFMHLAETYDGQADQSKLDEVVNQVNAGYYLGCRGRPPGWVEQIDRTSWHLRLF